MSFADDVEATPHLAGRLETGLGALRAQDRQRVTVRQTRSLRGSVDVDEALRPVEPEAARWDFVIAQATGQTGERSETLHWVEFHSASGGGVVAEMEAKLRWLFGWMKETPLSGYSRDIVWVASGEVAFTSRDPRLKRLAMRGLRFAGGHLKI
jgi:hypothetical protein